MKEFDYKLYNKQPATQLFTFLSLDLEGLIIGGTGIDDLFRSITNYTILMFSLFF